MILETKDEKNDDIAVTMEIERGARMQDAIEMMVGTETVTVTVTVIEGDTDEIDLLGRGRNVGEAKMTENEEVGVVPRDITEINTCIMTHASSKEVQSCELVVLVS